MNRQVDPYAYNICVRRVAFRGKSRFEARVQELPDICLYGRSASDAYDLAIEAVEISAEMFVDQGRPDDFPAPYVPKDDFSGRVTLRLPKSLHQILSMEAGREQVSLNQLLVGLISYRGGARRALGRPVIRSLTNVVEGEAPPAANNDNYAHVA